MTIWIVIAAVIIIGLIERIFASFKKRRKEDEIQQLSASELENKFRQLAGVWQPEFSSVLRSYRRLDSTFLRTALSGGDRPMQELVLSFLIATGRSDAAEILLAQRSKTLGEIDARRDIFNANPPEDEVRILADNSRRDIIDESRQHAHLATIPDKIKLLGGIEDALEKVGVTNIQFSSGGLWWNSRFAKAYEFRDGQTLNVRNSMIKESGGKCWHRWESRVSGRDEDAALLWRCLNCDQTQRMKPTIRKSLDESTA
jgi:hypothetical protein